MSAKNFLANCVFCKIIKQEIPSKLILETNLTYAFLDINPLSEGHTLVIPKYHAQFLHELPDEYLKDLLPVAKQVALGIGAGQYNILQNNGTLAHQVVEHVHFHVIPKPSQEEGLVILWHAQNPTEDQLNEVAKKITDKL